ncbi:hypothetical protein Nstercoris_02070 [Nitrosomonas stercoris]|uniref:Uncharacterized protein n=1 Tax=Nitrosomonas stercoris TaxID=1444684 RepID=A0A4Y1YP70_9PROT|nr:hypothetical protein Nstercoris_02070 [Nitrosomonas stercoris]
MKMISARLEIKNRLSGIILPLILMAGLTTSACAEDGLSGRDGFYQEWERATDAELSALRGGFILPNGVHINMSLEKFVHLNDVLVHSSSVQTPKNMLLQVGMQNLVPGSVAAPQLSTFIQNSLDSQYIEAITKINIEVSNLKGVVNGGNQRAFTEFLAPALLR